MTRVPPEVWIAPDLALLVCPPNPQPYDSDFLDNYWRFFLQHIDKVEELRGHGFSWLLSDEMIVGLMGDLPWSEVGRVPWARPMIIVFEEWRRHNPTRPISAPSGVQTTPDIVPAQVNAATKAAWLDLLAMCVQQNPARSHVASCPRQCVPHIDVQVPGSGRATAISLICQSADWDTVLQKVNPWVQRSLPFKGEETYEPPAAWRWGQDFPMQMTVRGSGFVDEQRRVWVWDEAEKHWDVQDKRQGRGKYIRVSPQGKRLKSRGN